MNISKLALITLLGSALMAFGCGDSTTSTGGSGGSGGGAGGEGGTAGSAGGAGLSAVPNPADTSSLPTESAFVTLRTTPPGSSALSRRPLLS